MAPWWRTRRLSPRRSRRPRTGCGGVRCRSGPLTLAVNLEPCLMCLGAAVTLGVERVLFALESPNDGAVDLLGRWQPPVEQSFFRRPGHIRGGILRRQSQELFAQYAAGPGPQGMRDWAQSLAKLPEG